MPVVYIDGGYKLLFGGGATESDFLSNIRSARNREVPEISTKLTAEYDENSTELTTRIIAINNETEQYSGRIRVYLTEIISRWNQQNSEPYHFALVDYIIDKEIKIPGNGNITIEDERLLSEFAVSDLLAEELMIISVIFNSKSTIKDSFPIDKSKGDFQAHYADSTEATLIVPGGNLPPQAKISYPKAGKFHMFGNAVFKTPFKRTYLTGTTQVIAEITDDSGIEKVEFYIDGTLVSTDFEEPYEYEIKKPSILGRLTISPIHTIKIIAYDNEGKTDDAIIEVITLFRISF